MAGLGVDVAIALVGFVLGVVSQTLDSALSLRGEILCLIGTLVVQVTALGHHHIRLIG